MANETKITASDLTPRELSARRIRERAESAAALLSHIHTSARPGWLACHRDTLRQLEVDLDWIKREAEAIIVYGGSKQ